jgi:hypothetical protein
LLLVGWIALTPDRAAASCGDYVHILAPGQTAPDAKGVSPDRPAKSAPACPCRGPECSKGSYPPALPGAPAPAPTGQSQLDAVLHADAQPDAGAGSLIGTESLFLPAPFPSSVFHPPRG